jgi:hypothetical protein
MKGAIVGMNLPEPANSSNEVHDLARLRAGLQAIRRDPQPVPLDVEQAMRQEISAHFEHASAVRRDTWRRWRIIPWTAAAAGILAAVWMLTPAYSPGPMLASVDPSDVDRNGTVDVLDAFSLARRLEAGSVVDAAADVNHDGHIDARDVDAIAQQAVALQSVTEAKVSG